jgi:tetratricopeptide (TPR) repeat protein
MMEKEIKEIIDDVFSTLDNNYENNLELLDIKKEKYKSHPRYNNLLDKILIKEKEYLDKKNKDAYKEMLNKYSESVDYGIALANEYFEKGKLEETKTILESLIKSFSNSYLNDEFANVVYFSDSLEKEIYSKINTDDRMLIECPVNKGYVYFMYGRILLEENKTKEAILSFDLARTYNPFLKEAYFFKALLLKVNQKFDEAKDEMLKAHKYLYKYEDLGDFYYFIGNYCYKFINKDYEFVMYKKSYNLNPVSELYEELKELKPIDRDLDYDDSEFRNICMKENIPVGFNENVEEFINKE